MKNNTLLSIRIKKELLVLAIGLLGFNLYSQVNYTPNPSDVAITTALNGGGLTISNATLVRGERATQIAIFSNGAAGANLGADSGVYFSTGDVNADLANRNLETQHTSSATNDYYADPDLVTLDMNAAYDPLIYTFNVTLGPSNSTLRVVYQFGSEEYPDYVGSIYNDAFGFFVSGPGIAGVANLAKLPSNNADITINNVNYGVEGVLGTGAADLSQSAFYLNNGHTTTIVGTRLDTNTNPGPFPYFVEFNGLTTVLTFDLVGLVPGGTYTFKIAVADSSDEYLDSGVFIRKISGVDGADVAVTKTVNNATPAVGTNVVFTVAASNLGPYNATNTVVTDLLPSGYTFVSAAPSVGTYNSATGIWNVGTLNNGANATLQITATVNSSGNYLNNASITASEIDLDLSNNNDSVATTPILQNDVSVTKTVNNTTPNVGAAVTFLITANNLGVFNATNTVVTDLLPSGYTFVSAVPSVGTYNAATGIWSIGTLSNGASATLQITATVNSSGNYLNNASITASEPDLNLANNTDSVVTMPNFQNELTVTKVVNNTTPTVGSAVTFTITASNFGQAIATGVAVADMIPSGYSVVSVTPSVGSWSAPNWTIGNLAVGASATLSVVATVNATGSYVNTAVVSGNEAETNLANNSATATVNPVLAIDAVNDDFTSTPINGNVGGIAGDLTLNDTLNGIAITDSAINITLNNDGGIPGLTIDVLGNLNIPAGTPPGNYVITYTICEELNPANCDTAEAMLVITETTSQDEITIFQLVTPNGDGDNDVFVIQNIELFPENTVEIYNRWGVMVFDAKGYGQNDKYFRGVSNGRAIVSETELPSGTYFYVVEYRNNEGVTKKRTGYLFLTR